MSRVVKLIFGAGLLTGLGVLIWQSLKASASSDNQQPVVPTIWTAPLYKPGDRVTFKRTDTQLWTSSAIFDHPEIVYTVEAVEPNTVGGGEYQYALSFSYMNQAGWRTAVECRGFDAGATLVSHGTPTAVPTPLPVTSVVYVPPTPPASTIQKYVQSNGFVSHAAVIAAGYDYMAGIITRADYDAVSAIWDNPPIGLVTPPPGAVYYVQHWDPWGRQTAPIGFSFNAADVNGLNGAGAISYTADRATTYVPISFGVLQYWFA